MKTNQVLTRKMGEFEVQQRTKDGMFNATALLKQWNEHSGMKKEVTKYFELSSTNELINVVMERESLNTQECAYLKLRGKYNGGTWMHPVIFVDFAMWINPSFKYDVIKFVYDQLIRYRNDAGDAYKEMSTQIQAISPDGVPFKDIIRGVSRAVNIVIYGRHESMIRNKEGDEKKARELFEIERDVAKMIKRGFIKTLVELRQFLLTEYRERHEPKLLEI